MQHKENALIDGTKGVNLEIKQDRDRPLNLVHCVEKVNKSSSNQRLSGLFARILTIEFTLFSSASRIQIDKWDVRHA